MQWIVFCECQTDTALSIIHDSSIKALYLIFIISYIDCLPLAFWLQSFMKTRLSLFICSFSIALFNLIVAHDNVGWPNFRLFSLRPIYNGNFLRNLLILNFWIGSKLRNIVDSSILCRWNPWFYDVLEELKDRRTNEWTTLTNIHSIHRKR